MIFLILIAIISIGILITYSYKFLNKKLIAINVAKSKINAQLDYRFKVIEKFSISINKHIPYEQTILSEIMQHRLQAQTAKNVDDDIIQFRNENQINLLIQNIDLFLNNYQEINKNNDINELKEELIYIQNNLKNTIDEYNESIIEYDKFKNLFPHNIVAKLFENKLKLNFHLWNN